MGLSSNAALKKLVDLALSGKYQFPTSGTNITPTDWIVGGIIDRRLDEKARAGFIHLKRSIVWAPGMVSEIYFIEPAVDSVTGVPNVPFGIACAIRVVGGKSSALPALAWYGVDEISPSANMDDISYLPIKKMQTFSGGTIPAGSRLFHDDSLQLAFDWTLCSWTAPGIDSQIYLMPCSNSASLAKRRLSVHLTRSLADAAKKDTISIELHLLVPCSPIDTMPFPPISYATSIPPASSTTNDDADGPTTVGRAYKFPKMPMRAANATKDYVALPTGVVAERPEWLVNWSGKSKISINTDGYHDVRISIPRFLAALAGMDKPSVHLNMELPIRAKNWSPELQVRWEENNSGINLLIRIGIPQDAPLEMLAESDDFPLKGQFVGFFGNIDIRLFPEIINGRIVWRGTVDCFIDWINAGNLVAWGLSPTAEKRLNRQIGDALAPYLGVIGTLALAIPSIEVQPPQANLDAVASGAPNGYPAIGVVWTGYKRDKDRFWASDNSFLAYLGTAQTSSNIVLNWALGTPYRTLLSSASQGQLDTLLSLGRLRQMSFDSSAAGIGLPVTLIGQMPPDIFEPAFSSASNKWLGYLLLLKQGYFGPSLDRLHDRFSVVQNLSMSPNGMIIGNQSPVRFDTTTKGADMLAKNFGLGYDVLNLRPTPPNENGDFASVQSFGSLVRRDRVRAQCLEIIFDTDGHFNIGTYLRENYSRIHSTAYKNFGLQEKLTGGSYGLLNFRIEAEFRFLTRHVVLDDTTATFTPTSHGPPEVMQSDEKLAEVKERESFRAKIFLESTGWATNAELAADLEILVESDGYWVSSSPSSNALGSFHSGELFLELVGVSLAWDAQFVKVELLGQSTKVVIKPVRHAFEPVVKPQIDLVGSFASMETNSSGNNAVAQALAFGLPTPASSGVPSLGTDVLLPTKGSWKVPLVKEDTVVSVIGTRWRFSRSAPIESLESQLRLFIKRIRLVIRSPRTETSNTGWISVACESSIYFSADDKTFSLVGLVGGTGTPVYLPAGIGEFSLDGNTFSVSRDFGSPNLAIATPDWRGLVSVPFVNVIDYVKKGYKDPWSTAGGVPGAMGGAMAAGTYRLVLKVAVNLDGETAELKMTHDASCKYSLNDASGQPLLWGIPFGAGSVGLTSQLEYSGGSVVVADRLLGSNVDFGLAHVSMQALPHIESRFDLTPFWGRACALQLTLTSLNIFNDLDNLGSGEYRMRIRVDNFAGSIGPMTAPSNSGVSPVAALDHTTKEINFDSLEKVGIPVGSITAAPGDLLQFRIDVVDQDETTTESLPSSLSWYLLETDGKISRSKEVVTSPTLKPTEYHPPGQYVKAGGNTKAFMAYIKAEPSFSHIAPKCWVFPVSLIPNSEEDPTNPVPNSSWITGFPIAMQHEPCLGYATGAVDSAALLFRKTSSDAWKVLVSDLQPTTYEPNSGPPYIYSRLYGPLSVPVKLALAFRLTDALSQAGENSPLPEGASFRVRSMVKGISLYSDITIWHPPKA